MQNPNEMVWHNDGHVLHLKIDRAELVVVSIDCPDLGECSSEEHGCVVRWFIDRFGMECNVGSCPASETLTICWTLSGSIRDMDAAQMWFMPLTDEVFNAWFVSRVKNFDDEP
jgi:hypothetical protein